MSFVNYDRIFIFKTHDYVVIWLSFELCSCLPNEGIFAWLSWVQSSCFHLYGLPFSIENSRCYGDNDVNYNDNDKNDNDNDNDNDNNDNMIDVLILSAQ